MGATGLLRDRSTVCEGGNPPLAKSFITAEPEAGGLELTVSRTKSIDMSEEQPTKRY